MITATNDINLGQGVTLEMVPIPGGAFLMGSSEDEKGRYSDEGPQHEVTVPEFWMGKYPITQAQWRVVAELPQIKLKLDPDPSIFKGDKRPVENVSWYEALEFCARLSGHTGQTYTLPSEAHWEYACRAGTTTPFHFGETLSKSQANFSEKTTTDVGSFLPNGFGLYDMHGNVWEWCLDHFHDSYKGAPADGSAWVTKGDSNRRMLRGGSWDDNLWDCRCAFRYVIISGLRDFNIGFRVVSAPPGTVG